MQLGTAPIGPRSGCEAEVQDWLALELLPIRNKRERRKLPIIEQQLPLPAVTPGAPSGVVTARMRCCAAQRPEQADDMEARKSEMDGAVRDVGP